MDKICPLSKIGGKLTECTDKCMLWSKTHNNCLLVLWLKLKIEEMKRRIEDAKRTV